MTKKVEQVGGSHYQTGDLPQHWDLVEMYDWDYFQGQIIKYLMRWKYKHPTWEKKLEDLKKARSFLDKYILFMEARIPATEVKVDGGTVTSREVTPETLNTEIRGNAAHPKSAPAPLPGHSRES